MTTSSCSSPTDRATVAATPDFDRSALIHRRSTPSRSARSGSPRETNHTLSPCAGNPKLNAAPKPRLQPKMRMLDTVWLVLQGHELEGLMCCAPRVLAHPLLREIAADGSQHGGGNLVRQILIDLFTRGEERLHQVRRMNVFGLAVIHDPSEAESFEALAVADAPVIQPDARVDEAAVAADEAGHLQQPLRPQLRKLAALLPHGVREGDSVREIEPADVLGDGVVGALLEAHVVAQQVHRVAAEENAIEIL